MISVQEMSDHYNTVIRPRKVREFATCTTPPEDEEWKVIPIVGWDDIFLVSNYGRIFNTKTKSLMDYSLHYTFEFNFNNPYLPCENFHNNSILVTDIIRSAFYPEIINSHVNVIFKDRDFYNLKLSNLTFVPNEYYIGDDSYRNLPVFVEDEETGYFIDVNGVVTTPKGNRILRKQHISLRYNLNYVEKLRSKILADAFIPNPNRLRNVNLIIKPLEFDYYEDMAEGGKKERKLIYKQLDDANTFIVKPNDPKYAKLITKPLFTTVKNIYRSNRYEYELIEIK